MYVKRILAVGLFAVAVGVAGCQGTPSDSDTTLAVGVGGSDCFKFHQKTSFQVLPGMQNPVNEKPPPGYVLYGCYPIDPNNPNSLEFCLYVDPSDLTKPVLARPGGSPPEVPFHKLAPDRRLPDPNNPEYHGGKFQSADGSHLDCIWLAHDLSEHDHNFSIDFQPHGVDPMDGTGDVTFTAPSEVVVAAGDGMNSVVSINGIPIQEPSHAKAGDIVRITGSSLGVAAVMADTGFGTTSFNVGRTHVEIQNGGLWPFAAVITTTHQGSDVSWYVLDPGWQG